MLTPPPPFKTNVPPKRSSEEKSRSYAFFDLCRSKFGRHVHIPEVHAALTSSRILTMEYVEGAMPKDQNGLKKLGFSPKKVLLV